ncbi:Transcription factor MYC/MYB N-terminal [Macleaya cordata]|uniref:Transcription factor MYC/MYB N-terminal n=1 Tax=Macleaya cordata TaxID=56857 RepID=A0A200PQ77_MACCD|nr:Transcription factor MYC/MYB N-terminal [Macleaya cordata]
MVGSGGSDRSKEAVGMMALHEALRGVCLNSDWTYSVFWTIRPRPRSRGGNGCKVGDDNGSLMLMWEDGFCRGRVAECLEDIDGEDPVRKAFSKMSIQLYNYGEGLMGKVASDKCHKWVFKEPSECEPNISNYWQSSFDAIPPEWTDQFNSGIQTIAVIQAGHGLLQLGSCKIIPEDLHFVLRMRHTFESLGYQSGFYLSQLFSSTRNSSSSSSVPMKQCGAPNRPPPPIFNWSQRPLPSATSVVASPNFQNSARLGLPQNKDETHLFLLPNSSDAQMEDMMAEHEADIKWPNGLSFFNALTGRADDAKLLFGSEGIGNKTNQQHHSLLGGKNSNSAINLSSKADESKAIAETSNSLNHHGNRSENNAGGENVNDYLSLESHSNNVKKMENKFKRSFTLPARMASSTSSSSMDHHQHHPVDYRNTEAGIYSDLMETFLE